MRKLYPPERLLTVAALTVLGAACQQLDQVNPFDLLKDQPAVRTIGPSGGTISVLPGFSLEFPAGSLAGSVSVSVSPLDTEPFPSEAGPPVTGSAFDGGPFLPVLAVPATVELAVPANVLAEGDEVRLSVAVLREDGTVVTFGGTYDVTNGILTAEIDELGPIAAVITADAIALIPGVPDALNGGSFPPPPAPPAPAGAALAGMGGLEFSSFCSPEARQCFTSGLIRMWADDVVRERLGEDLFLVSPTVEADLEFLAFDQNGFPTSVVGSMSIEGDLRARINRAVSSYEVDESVRTGTSSDSGPVQTSIQVSGNTMVIGVTTDTGGFEETFESVEYSINGIGTTEMLTLEVEIEIEFENDVGLDTIGVVTVHVRLRR